MFSFLPRAVISCASPSDGADFVNVIDGPLFLTCDALASSLCHVCVFFREFMAPVAMSFTRIDGAFPITSHEIGECRHWFKMVWVDTLGALTQMIQLHAVWNWANEQFIREAMCVEQLVLIAKSPIAIRSTAKPNPASRCVLDQPPKSPYVCVVNFHAQHFTMTGI